MSEQKIVVRRGYASGSRLFGIVEDTNHYLGALDIADTFLIA
jgi:hypothetical protein